MCRLFGFRSVSPAQVHTEMISHPNSLAAQSEEHRDGWGLAYYDGERTPVVQYGLLTAKRDPDFDRASRNVLADTVLAHVRLASIGEVALRNAHPFMYGRWTFAHNGTVQNFTAAQAAIEDCISPHLRPYIRGETDSERCFYLFLTHLADDPSPQDPRVLARALVRTVLKVSELTDPLTPPSPEAKPSSLNFLVTDGHWMAATRRSRTLFLSERRPKLTAEVVDPPAQGSTVEQLVIASEELTSENHWHEVPDHSVVILTPDMKLFRWRFNEV